MKIEVKFEVKIDVFLLKNCSKLLKIDVFLSMKTDSQFLLYFQVIQDFIIYKTFIKFTVKRIWRTFGERRLRLRFRFSNN